MIRSLCVVLLVSVLAVGCSNAPQTFTRAEPQLALEQFFVGRTHAWGLVEDRFGNLRRQFEVVIEGRIEAGQLILDERFQFSDGEQSRRVWRIEPLGDGRYRGRADDVIGEATGLARGNQLHWQYRLQLALGNSQLEVTFDDWLWQQHERVMINRATFSKWGIRLGTVTLFFLREAHDG